jgi:predicted DNA-binding transcriptional regulator YafY
MSSIDINIDYDYARSCSRNGEWMSQPASRLITLILLLQRRPNQKAGELAKELGVSVRTLHRYFAALDEMGIPIYSERGPNGGFSLVRGYKMPPLVLTPEEAVAVYLGTSLVGEMWGDLYAAAGAGALAKLDNLLPDEQRDEIGWARRSLLATGMHRADQKALSGTLEKLRRANRERRSVTMAYRSSNQPNPNERELDPYALVHRWGWWYVVGYCHLRQEVRTFRVDRIVELTLLQKVFTIPADFDVHGYLASENLSQPMMRVRMHFSPRLAQPAREYTLSAEAMETQADGSLILTMLTPDLSWAVSTALAYGPEVSMLEPPEAVQMVKAWALAIAKKY